jgi:hypothetical protein
VIDVVPARGEAFDQATHALDVRGGAHRIALGIVHSEQDGDCTGSSARLAWRLS